MQFTNPTWGSRIQAQAEAWDGTSIRVTRDCAGHRATNQGCALDLGDGRCDRPVLAVAAGTVTYRDTVQGIIRIDHGGGWSSDYAHMNPLLVAVGTKVTQGQQIGEIGDAHDPAVLNFSGCHLHFGILLNGVEQDPWPYLNATLGGDMTDIDSTLFLGANGKPEPRPVDFVAGPVRGYHRDGSGKDFVIGAGGSWARADARCAISGRPDAPVGSPFVRMVDGIFTDSGPWYVFEDGVKVKARDDPLPAGGITQAQLTAAVKAATDPLTAQVVALNAKIANARTALN